LYRPGRFFGILATISLLAGLFWGLFPVEFYLWNRRLEEWMIYRLLLSGFLITCCWLFASAGVLAERILALVFQRRRESSVSQFLDQAFSRRRLLLAATVAVLLAILLVWPGLREYFDSGRVTMHWSRPLVAVFLLQFGVVAGTHAVLQKIVGLWKIQLAARTSHGAEQPS
jgi:hypothetical protein